MPDQTTFSHYRILERVGGGGMGVVYKAEDLRLHRFVALKFLPPNVVRDPQALARFRREAQSASALNHPNICSIYDIGEHDGETFIVMEFIDGITLADHIATRKFDLNETLSIVIQICEALDATHAEGIIHRDLKPGNILLNRRGHAKVVDFGLAKTTDEGPWQVSPTGVTDDGPLTADGHTPGTLAYMSPDQVLGKPLDARTDLFSFGVVLYEMVTGTPPFRGSSPGAVAHSILGDTPVSPVRINPAVPVELERIICKSLEKDRDLRYQHASDLLADLKRLKRESESGRTAVVSSATTSEKRPRAVPWKLLAAAALVIAVAIGAFLYFRKGPTLTEKDTVVLADFQNKTGDAVFDDALKQALSANLIQSPFLNILPEGTVRRALQFMGRPTNEKLVGDTAHEVCVRTNSKILIAGSIESLANQYLLGLSAVNCASGELISQQQVQAEGKQDVLKTLDRAAKELRAKLGESIGSVQKFGVPVEQATTTSLEALQAYSLGIKTWYEQGDEAALPFYKRAMELDPNFALAYASATSSYQNLGMTSDAIASSTRAYQLRDRVSERERYFITAFYDTYALGDLQKAVDDYRLWQKTYPRDPWATGDLSATYFQLGQIPNGLREAERQLDIGPDDSMTYSNLALAYITVNRLGDAQKSIDLALKRNLDSGFLRIATYTLAFLKHDDATMQQQLAWTAGKAGYEDLLLASQSDTDAYFGRMSKAREYSQKAEASAEASAAKETAATIKAIAALHEAEVGNRAMARDLALSARAMSPGQPVQVYAAMTLARAGDVVNARSIADALQKQYPQNTQIQKYWVPSIQASIELRQNRPAEALRILQITSPYELAQVQPLGSIMYPVYIRGEALLALHRSDDAATEFQKVIDQPGLTANYLLGSLAHLGLAGAYANAGDTARATAAYKQFLSIWKGAAPDVPILKQAHDEFQKLKSRTLAVRSRSDLLTSRWVDSDPRRVCGRRQGLRSDFLWGEIQSYNPAPQQKQHGVCRVALPAARCPFCAIHSASFWSVLRPGTFLMCCAFAKTTVNCPSRVFQTGFQ